MTIPLIQAIVLAGLLLGTLLGIARAGKKWPKISAVRAPIVLFGLVLLLEIVLSTIPGHEGFKQLTYLGLLLSGAYAVVRLLSFVLFDVAYRANRGVEPPRLLRNLFTLLLFALLATVSFRMALHVELTALLTTSAVVTAVVGLALQDTLGNLFSGLALHLESTFHPGDFIAVGGVEGTIEDVGWRSIRIRTLRGSQVHVPNGLAAKGLVEVTRRLATAERILSIAVSLDAEPEKIRPLLESAALETEGARRDPAPRALLRSFGEYFQLYELRYCPKAYEDYPAIDARVHARVWYSLLRAGIPLPYPIRHVYQHQKNWAEQPADLSEILSLLRRAPLFQGIPSSEIDRLAASGRRLAYAPGEVVVREGEPGKELFLIAEGTLRVQVLDASNVPHTVKRLAPGDSFGERALMMGGMRAATVAALTPCRLYSITQEAIAPLLEAQPDFVEAMSRILAGIEEERGRLLEETLGHRPKHCEIVTEQSSLLNRIRKVFGIE